MNFSPIIAWARSTSYDVVGIFLPGIVFLITFWTISLYMPGPRLGYEFEFLMAIRANINLNASSGYLIYLLIAYLAGFSIKSIGDSITGGTYLNSIFLRKYFFIGENLKRHSYSESNSELFKLAKFRLIRILNRKGLPEVELLDENNEWPIFYRLSQSILEVNQYPTKAVTYQNRYELFKSLSVVFILFSAIMAIQIFVSLVVLLFHPSWILFYDIILIILLTTFLLLLAAQYRSIYLKFWKNLGDTLITSMLTIDGLEQDSKAKNKKKGASS